MKSYNTNTHADEEELGVMAKDRASSLVGVSCIIRQYEESRFIVTIPGLPIGYRNDQQDSHNEKTNESYLQKTTVTNNHGYNLRSLRKYPKLPPKPEVNKCQERLKYVQDAKNGNKPREGKTPIYSAQIKQPSRCLLTEPLLLQIAEKLGSEWQSLLIHLGLKNAQIDHIKSETSHVGDLHQTIFRGLLKWKQRCRKEDQAIYELQSCLQQVGRNDIAQELNEFEINCNGESFMNTLSLQEKVENLERRVMLLENRQCNCRVNSGVDTTDGGEEFEIVSIEEVGLAKDHYYTGGNQKSRIQDWMECGLQRMTTWSYSVEHVHEEETMEIDFGF